MTVEVGFEGVVGSVKIKSGMTRPNGRQQHKRHPISRWRLCCSLQCRRGEMMEGCGEVSKGEGNSRHFLAHLMAVWEALPLRCDDS
jgi:hypothetical protein